MAAENCISNAYEESRKQRLQENMKRFQDLGISNISKTLSDLTSSEKKSKQSLPKSKAANTEIAEPRRSTRARNTVASYRDDLDIELPPMRKKSRSNSSSWASYIVRPLDEVKLASHDDRTRALRAAEEFQSNLQSGKPSFVKSMVRSHVYSCFWLGLPTQFCKDHLPKKDLDMILEDENGSTYNAKFLGTRTGLSGGWRGFALDHKLDDGDAVVFELVEPYKFKVYTFRVSSPLSSQRHVDNADEEGSVKAKNASKDQKKLKSHSSKKQKSKKEKIDNLDERSNTQTSQPRDKTASTEISKTMNSVKENSVAAEDHGKRDESASKTEVQPVEENDKPKKHAFKPRKKPAPKLLRRRA